MRGQIRGWRLGSRSDIVVYLDASGQDGHLGAAVVALNNDQEVLESRQVQVGPADRWFIHVAELIGIFHAISTVLKLFHQHLNNANKRLTTVTILCDSRSALQAIESVKNVSGQQIIHAILQAVAEVQEKNIALRLQWISGRCDNPGNNASDRLAKAAAHPGQTHSFRPLLTREMALIHDNIPAQWEQEWRSSIKGDQVRKLDTALPANHTRKLYGFLPWNQAYLLIQLCTGHNWLSTFANKRGFRDNNQCPCGAQRTVVHMDRPGLQELRRKLRREVGDTFNSVSSLLGGSNQGKKGNPDIILQAKQSMLCWTSLKFTATGDK